MKNSILFLMLLFTYMINSQEIALQEYATGFNLPLGIENAGDDRLFVLEKGGAIKIINNDGTVNSTPFMNISSLISTNSERGLLGLAFHPDYATNGYFYINYTDTAGDTVISRFERNSTNENLGDINTELILLQYDQPFSNHNGGGMVFGPDGKLYIGSGDGGSGGDPGNRAQRINTLLGKLLRLDVDIPSPYIPSDNPFVGVEGEDEIWAYGLRNPWRFSFDSQTNDLWIGDVGQGDFEEINKAANTAAGLNYGWRCYEGNSPFNTNDCPPDNTLTFPIADYSDANSRLSVTGGFVYRGSSYQDMQGKYIFADYVTNEIGMIDSNDASGNITFFGPFDGGLVSFGVDQNNELYVVKISGSIHRVIDENSLSTADFSNSRISIHPNPAKNMIKISGNKNLDKITILDLKGRILKSEKLLDPEKAAYNISGTPPGIYIIKITTLDQKEFNQKLIIK